MRGALRSVGVVALALLIVSTAVLSGVGGSASPVAVASAEWSEECDVSDSLIGSLIRTFAGGDGCYWVSSESDVENLTATDGYASALGLKDSTDSYVTTTGNFMENSRTVAYSKAKIVVVNELNNQTSVSVAHNEVNTTVRDYYSRSEIEAVRDYNAKVEHLWYLNNSTSTEVQLLRSGSQEWEITGISSSPMTLQNGSTVNVTRFEAYLPSTGDSATYGLTTSEQLEVQVKDPGTGSWETVLDQSDYAGLLGEMQTQNQQVIDNMAPYVPAVYDQWAAGQIDSTDLAMSDPTVIANEASTSLNSTGYYGHASILLASLGAGGDVNVSHTVETSDGTTMNGTLFYTGSDAPIGGWETNVSYNQTDFNGTFYYSVQRDDGTAGIVDLSNYGDSFVLTSATNTKTGEQVNTTEVHRYTYDSTNASALAEEIERLEQLRAEYEAQLDDGGSTGWGIGTADKGLIALVALAAILLTTRN